MGCFNATCIASGLAIEARDKVRYMALSRVKGEDNGNVNTCYVGGRWELYGVPIKAEYNDYGSIENWDENSCTTEMFFKILSDNAVEKGTGNNTVHDVPVRKNMDIQGWLSALWEGRVWVNRQPSPNRHVLTPELRELLKKPQETFPEPSDPEGVPTLARIEAVITAAGKPLAKSYGDGGLLVDEVSPGFLRIRLGSHEGHEKALANIVPLFHAAGYAAMLTAGTGSYSMACEILVAPLPNKEVCAHFSGLQKAPDFYSPRPISQAMVREDVWQILLKESVEGYPKKQTFQALLKDALKTLKEDLNTRTTPESLAGLSVKEQIRILQEQLGRMLEPHPSSLFNYCMPHNHRAVYQSALAYEKDLGKLEEFVTNLAETMHVETVFGSLHGQWHPSTNSSQEGRWEDKRKFLRKLTKIRGRYEE